MSEYSRDTARVTTTAAQVELMRESGVDECSGPGAGSGNAGLWPELFDAGAALVKSQFPQFPAGAVEVLPGTGWLAPELADNAIDWVMRRPEGHVVTAKIHFANRLHRAGPPPFTRILFSSQPEPFRY